ncbi:MAG: helix-turn-helix domain-containing protein [Oscillospiraceae bacterium]
MREPETYQCYPSYKTIGHAIGMSENTVAKYVRQLEEKGLIYTEPTMVREQRWQTPERKSALHRSPYPRCMKRSMSGSSGRRRRTAARCRVAELLKKSNAQGRQNALCAPFREEASPSPDQGIEAGCEPFSADFWGTKEKAG